MAKIVNIHFNDHLDAYLVIRQCLSCLSMQIGFVYFSASLKIDAAYKHRLLFGSRFKIASS